MATMENHLHNFVSTREEPLIHRFGMNAESPTASQDPEWYYLPTDFHVIAHSGIHSSLRSFVAIFLPFGNFIIRFGCSGRLSLSPTPISHSAALCIVRSGNTEHVYLFAHLNSRESTNSPILPLVAGSLFAQINYLRNECGCEACTTMRLEWEIVWNSSRIGISGRWKMCSEYSMRFNDSFEREHYC